MREFFKNFFKKEYIFRDLEKESILRKVAHILVANFIRSFFVLICGFFVYYAYGIQNNKAALAGSVPIIIIVLDGVYNSFFRRGKEYSWYIF